MVTNSGHRSFDYRSKTVLLQAWIPMVGAVAMALIIVVGLIVGPSYTHSGVRITPPPSVPTASPFLIAALFAPLFLLCLAGFLIGYFDLVRYSNERIILTQDTICSFGKRGELKVKAPITDIYGYVFLRARVANVKRLEVIRLLRIRTKVGDIDFDTRISDFPYLDGFLRARVPNSSVRVYY